MLMEKAMKSVKAFTNKYGNYFVEASIVLPIFIIGVTVLLSIIPIMAKCESIIFSAADEQRVENIKAIYRSNPVALPLLVTSRCKKENRNLDSFIAFSKGYKMKRRGLDNLIAQGFSARFENNDPLNLFNKVEFTGSIMSRAFVGKTENTVGSGRDEFEREEKSEQVYIFPEFGEKYHNSGCRTLKENVKTELLTKNLRRKYKPCKLCGAKKAHIGDMVQIFNSEGNHYHLSNCKSLNKHYIKIEKAQAIQRGYGPCAICGG